MEKGNPTTTRINYSSASTYVHDSDTRNRIVTHSNMIQVQRIYEGKMSNTREKAQFTLAKIKANTSKSTK